MKRPEILQFRQDVQQDIYAEVQSLVPQVLALSVKAAVVNLICVVPV